LIVRGIRAGITKRLVVGIAKPLRRRDLVIKIHLLEKRQHHGQAAALLRVGCGRAAGRQSRPTLAIGQDLVRIVIIVQRHAQLLQLIAALNPPGGFPR
jgi:hypothetical protein